MKRTIARLLKGFIIMTAAFSLLAGCQNAAGISAGKGSGNQSESDYVEGKELLCIVNTKEEAEAIAKQYGITLVEFSYGVATFHTDDNPNDVIAMGIKLGYPELSLNGTVHAY